MISNKYRCTDNAPRRREQDVEADQRLRAGLRTDSRERLKQVERDNRGLRHSYEILREASAYFVQAPVNDRSRH